MISINSVFEGVRFLLASGSPRRHELLRLMDLNFEIVKNDVDEEYPLQLKGEEIVLFLSEKKSKGYQIDIEDNQVLITSDTIVWLGNKSLEKAQNESQAAQMLRELSGNTHTVFTGVCLRSNNKMTSFYESTQVTFADLNESEIDYYLSKYKPYDKAGAYGMQEWIGINKVKSIQGSYTNVVGLPTERLYHELIRFLS